MARKPETTFRVRVMRDLKTLEHTAIIPIQQRSIVGDPDLILCVRGGFVALELKAERGIVSVLQGHKLMLIEKAGGFAFVAKPTTWKYIFAIIQQIEKGVFK